MNCVKNYALGRRANVSRREVRFVVNRVGNNFAVNVFGKSAQIFVVVAENRNAVVAVDVLDKNFERRTNSLDCAVMVKVVVFNVGDDSDFRFERDK